MSTLKFSHKIMLAAALVVVAAFASFALYNDYLQRHAIQNNLTNYLRDMGGVSAGNIQHWLGGASSFSRTSPNRCRTARSQRP